MLFISIYYYYKDGGKAKIGTTLQKNFVKQKKFGHGQKVWACGSLKSKYYREKCHCVRQ